MVHLIGVALKIDFALRDARGIHADIVSRMRSELELSANRGAERERHAFYCGYARGSGEGKILLGEVVDRLETAWAKFSTEVRP